MTPSDALAEGRRLLESGNRSMWHLWYSTNAVALLDIADAAAAEHQPQTIGVTAQTGGALTHKGGSPAANCATCQAIDLLGRDRE